MEGLNDIEFLSRLSSRLSIADPKIPDLTELSRSGNVIFIPFGGGNPLSFTGRFRALGCSEFHLYDREQPPESAYRLLAAERVNLRRNCRAFVTSRRAIENFLHPGTIPDADGGPGLEFGADDCVPTRVARRWHEGWAGRRWDDLPRHRRTKLAQRTKRWLNTVAVEHMTLDRLNDCDPAGEVLGWFMAMQSLLPLGAVSSTPRFMET